MDSYGLTGANWEAVRARVGAIAHLEDASELVRRLRLVKSPAELAHIRTAGRLADAAVTAVAATAAPGVLDAELAAASLRAILAGGARRERWQGGSGGQQSEHALLGSLRWRPWVGRELVGTVMRGGFQ